ncbi:hypothetical protein AMATHDRAFT_48608 [Amanita thiersii Skay4041]|uniref:Transmembrane protein n=1 Tax=Amanita thiersii Skay4041 TaxID=703135 RepID=A0A2A9NG27_9AGAR|nr:hypothetical protein AMATHDRAFT_48608 [Amanita thiersii Skay4041]
MTRSSVNPRIFWPSTIVIIQLSILILLWSFFIITSVQVVPLPDSLASTVKANPQTTTLVVAVIASLVSGLTCYVDNDSQRCIHIRGPEVNLDVYRCTGRSCASTADSRMSSTRLTAVFSPSTIHLSYPIRGWELDVTDPKFPGFLGPLQSRWFIQPDIQPDTQYTVSPAMLSSGEMAVRARLNLPSFFSFNNYSYVGSTHGVLPANLVPMSNVLPSTKSPQTFLPPNSMLTKTRKINGLKSTYTMIQQGYTPTVKCRAEEWTTQITFNASTQLLTGTIDCPNNEWSDMRLVVGKGRNAILAFMCFVYTEDFPAGATAEYDIILKGYGQVYGSLPTYVCRINSDVTTVEVKYDSPPTLYGHDVPNLLNSTMLHSTVTPVPRLGYEALEMFLRQVVNGQTYFGNNIGNIISSFYTVLLSDPSSLTAIWSHTVQQQESYIRGSLEFASTLVRTNLTTRSAPNDFLINESDTFPLRPLTGTYTIETMGWSQSVGLAHRATFAAPTLITVASLLIILYGTFRITAARSTPMPTSTHFDPRDTLHVVAASAAGGLEFYPDYMKDGVPNSQKFGVRLDLVNPKAGKVGFVAAQGAGYVPVANPLTKYDSLDTVYPGYMCSEAGQGNPYWRSW